MAIDIAQGMATARGVIAEAEYDDGWLYRIDVTEGDDCQLHRRTDGQLWVCESEVTAEEPAANIDAILEDIARDELRIPTQRERKSDRHDFHEVSVWDLKDALLAAYRAGQNDAK